MTTPGYRAVPGTLSRSSQLLAPPTVLGSITLPREGNSSRELAGHALDPPSGVDPQALLQVFRI
jgi:hypothetical protein